jgi:NAD(P)-dependent dehydrogenase (short-subunit alcohol dehydrogenase family)
VSKEAEIEAMYAAALHTFGRVDAAIHVAGTQAGRSAEINAEEYERMTSTNLRGVLLSCKYAIRAMLPTGGGSIVNFSSVGALNVEDRAPISYAAAKAGVHSLTKALAVEYGPRGTRANVVAPGFTLTELTRKASPEILQHMSAKAALKRAALPQEQAEVAHSSLRTERLF